MLTYPVAVDAVGDIKLLQVLQTLLVSDVGVLVLGLPVAAADALVWNAHR